MQSSIFIKANKEGLFISLKKGRALQVKYKNPMMGEYFTLTYNQRTMASSTGPQKPDNLLVLRKEIQDIEYKYVLDAKYKMNYAKVEEQDLSRCPRAIYKAIKEMLLVVERQSIMK